MNYAAHIVFAMSEMMSSKHGWGNKINTFAAKTMK